MARLDPPAAETIQVRVLNASGTEGLETMIGKYLRGFGLQIVGTGTDTSGRDGKIIVRYGPEAVGAAWQVKAFLLAPDDVYIDAFDVNRIGPVVEISLGGPLAKPGTITEVNERRAHMPMPTAPPGTCTSPSAG